MAASIRPPRAPLQLDWLILIAASLSTAFGCGSTFEDQFQRVEVGETKAAVVERLGAPDRAHRFAFDSSIMGPPEVLLGIVSEGAEVEELTWTRSAVRGDSVVFQIYASPNGRVLATTSHGVGTVF